MSTQSLKALLTDELKDLYNAEKQLVKALPKIAGAALSRDLQLTLNSHLEETKLHVDRLEQAFRLLDVPAKDKTCPAMKGLIKEGCESLDHRKASSVRDAQIIGSAQRIEHYEIAAYGTARALAETLGESGVANLLQLTLDEESEADKKLTIVAANVNDGALAEVGL